MYFSNNWRLLRYLQDESLLQPHKDCLQHCLTQDIKPSHMLDDITQFGSLIQRVWKNRPWNVLYRTTHHILRLVLYLVLRLQHSWNSFSKQLRWQNLSDTTAFIFCFNWASVFNFWTWVWQTPNLAWCSQSSKIVALSRTWTFEFNIVAHLIRIVW